VLLARLGSGPSRRAQR